MMQESSRLSGIKCVSEDARKSKNKGSQRELKGNNPKEREKERIPKQAGSQGLVLEK